MSGIARGKKWRWEENHCFRRKEYRSLWLSRRNTASFLWFLTPRSLGINQSLVFKRAQPHLLPNWPTLDSGWAYCSLCDWSRPSGLMFGSFYWCSGISYLSDYHNLWLNALDILGLICLCSWVSRYSKIINAGTSFPFLHNIQVSQTCRNRHCFHQGKAKHFCLNCYRNFAGENQQSIKAGLPLDLSFCHLYQMSSLFLWAFGWCQDSIRVAKGPKSSWWVEARGLAHSSAGWGDNILLLLAGVSTPDSYPRPLSTNDMSLESLKLGLQPCLFPFKFTFWTESKNLLKVHTSGTQAFVLWTQMICVSGNHSTRNENEQPTLQYMLCFQKPQYFQASPQEPFDVTLFWSPLVVQKCKLQ